MMTTMTEEFARAQYDYTRERMLANTRPRGERHRGGTLAALRRHLTRRVHPSLRHA
jgi:hypothetical protein